MLLIPLPSPFPPARAQDLARFDELSASLPPAARPAVGALWQRYTAARYTAELMSGRAARLCKVGRTQGIYSDRRCCSWHACPPACLLTCMPCIYTCLSRSRAMALAPPSPKLPKPDALQHQTPCPPPQELTREIHEGREDLHDIHTRSVEQIKHAEHMVRPAGRWCPWVSQGGGPVRGWEGESA
jgi:hypothetical protein